MKPNWAQLRLWVIPIILAEIAITWDIKSHTFPTYDDGKNLMVADEIANGQYANLFHHASPVFFLLYSLLRQAGIGPNTITFLQSQFHILGIGLCLVYFSRGLALSDRQLIYAFLGAVLCPIGLFTGCSFSIEAMALALFGCGLMAWLMVDRWAVGSIPSFLASILAGSFMALAATTNYKMLIPLVIILGLEVWQGKLATKRVIPAMLGFAVVGIGLIVLGVAFGRPWYGLPAAVLAVGARAANPDSAGHSALDIAFYPLYFASFDNILMLLGLAAGIILAFKGRPSGSQLTSQLTRPPIGHPVHIVLGFGLACLIIFSLLPRAPRALYTALPAFSLAFMWACSQGPRLAKILLPPIFMGLSLLQSAFWFYPYGTQALRTAAYYISAHPAATISPYSPRVYPYLEADNRALLRTTLACQPPTIMPNTLLLLDPYAHIVSNCLPTPTNLLPKFETPDLGYQSPILWLEHAEYRGWSFTEVIQQRKARKAQNLIQIY